MDESPTVQMFPTNFLINRNRFSPRLGTQLFHLLLSSTDIVISSIIISVSNSSVTPDLLVCIKESNFLLCCLHVKDGARSFIPPEYG